MTAFYSVCLYTIRNTVAAMLGPALPVTTNVNYLRQWLCNGAYIFRKRVFNIYAMMIVLRKRFKIFYGQWVQKLSAYCFTKTRCSGFTINVILAS